MDHISIYITKEDFETTDYMEPTDCALATALKRNRYKLGGDGRLGVGGSTAWIGGSVYGILEWEEIQGKYGEVVDGTITEGLMVNLLKI